MLSQLSYLATTFLSVTVMSDLKWNTHISNTCAKTRQLLGFCTVFFHMADSACLSHLYKCLVLPTLDYCSAVWDHTAVTLSNQLESLFRGSWPCRLVTKHWSSTPDDNLLCSLKWTTLQTRRKSKWPRSGNASSGVTPSYHNLFYPTSKS